MYSKAVEFISTCENEIRVVLFSVSSAKNLVITCVITVITFVTACVITRKNFNGWSLPDVHYHWRHHSVNERSDPMRDNTYVITRWKTEVISKGLTLEKKIISHQSLKLNTDMPLAFDGWAWAFSTHIRSIHSGMAMLFHAFLSDHEHVNKIVYHNFFFCAIIFLIKIKIHTHNLQVPFTNYLGINYYRSSVWSLSFLKCLDYPTSP